MELIAPEDLPEYVPGRVLAQSDGLGWDGVSLRAYHYRGQDVVIPSMRDFMLVAYRQGVTPMQRRFDGGWTRETCGPGVVSLLTRSQQSHWHWTEDVKVTHIYLTQKFVSDVAQEVCGKAILEVSLPDILRTDDPIMTHAINAISIEANASGLAGNLYIDAVARQLSIHLLRKYADIAIQPCAIKGGLSNIQSDRVISFIEENIHRNMDIKEIAAEVGIGPCTFSRLFRQTNGVPPYAYVIERRLDRAQRLLRYSSAPIKEIAAMCGFSDQAHLTRMFSRRYQTTPSAFRKTL